MKRPLVVVALCLAVLTSCGSLGRTALPACSGDLRLALLAQAVPSAAYVPCLSTPTAGWQVEQLQAGSAGVRFRLLSDRAQGHAVLVSLRHTCNITDATPESSPAPGVRRSVHLRSIQPRYAGTRFDVFPGGCISYAFDFRRGPHIALMADLSVIVGVQSRRELRSEVRRRLGEELTP